MSSLQNNPTILKFSIKRNHRKKNQCFNKKIRINKQVNVFISNIIEEIVKKDIFYDLTKVS